MLSGHPSLRRQSISDIFDVKHCFAIFLSGFRPQKQVKVLFREIFYLGPSRKRTTTFSAPAVG